MIAMALALGAAGGALAQPDPRRASPAYGLGTLHAMYQAARPCFRPAEEAELQEALRANMARLVVTPEEQAAFHLGVRDTHLQQRYIPRGDRTACEQIILGLRHYAALPRGG